MSCYLEGEIYKCTSKIYCVVWIFLVYTSIVVPDPRWFISSGIRIRIGCGSGSKSKVIVHTGIYLFSCKKSTRWWQSLTRNRIRIRMDPDPHWGNKVGSALKACGSTNTGYNTMIPDTRYRIFFNFHAWLTCTIPVSASGCRSYKGVKRTPF